MNLKVGDMIQSNANKSVGIIVRISEQRAISEQYVDNTPWITIKWMDTDKKAGYTSTYPYDYLFGTTFHKVS